MVDHIMVGHLIGYTGNAAIGVSWQIFLVVIVFIASLFTGQAVLVARFVGAGDPTRSTARLPGVSHRAGDVRSLSAPIGYFAAPYLLDFVQRRARGAGAGAAVPARSISRSASA